MKSYETEHESFWAGEFGNDYISRNEGAEIIASNAALFSKVFASTNGINTVIEFGANIGLNLQAIKTLIPSAALSAVEINDKAVGRLKQLGYIDVYKGSMLEWVPDRSFNFVLIKTVLIHISPLHLSVAYEKLYQTSNRYICLAEYYNNAPLEVAYRGHASRLFKRDFAGEMMKQFPDLELIDYGFVYQNDPVFPLDDISWFLLKKP